MNSPPEGPRHATITKDDHGALLSMTTWFLMATMILTTTTRIVVRLTTQHLRGFDDILVIIATLFGIGSTIAISLGVKSGLGRRISSLSQAEIDTLQKDIYSATTLYILTVAVSKLSILTFLTRLAVAAVHKMILLVLTAVVGCWTIAAVFGIAFQCSAPRPWDVFFGKCFSILSFWIGVGAVDIITDIIMIALPVNIVWGLQMDVRKKIIVIFIFSVRQILIITAIVRLVYLSRTISSSDPTFDSIPHEIATQCHSTLSVIVACSPSLKPFIDHTKSGMLNISLFQHTAGTTYAKDSYNMQALSKGSKQCSKGNSKAGTDAGASNGSQNDSSNRLQLGGGPAPMAIEASRPSPQVSVPVALQAAGPDVISHSTNVRPGHRRDTPDILRDDRVSEDSGDSQKRIIRHTKTWDVRYDDYHSSRGQPERAEIYMSAW